MRLARMSVLTVLLFASCGPAADPSARSGADFEAEFQDLCSELGDDMASVQGDGSDPSVGGQLLENLEEFRADLEDLEVLEERQKDYDNFVDAIDATIAASERQVEATKSRNLVAALTARADAAESKLEVFEAVQGGDFPQECAGDTEESLHARVFAGSADLVCYDFVGRFGALMSTSKGFDGPFIRDNVVPLWRDFVSDLRAILPPGESRHVAEQMASLYDRAGDALLDLGDALEQRSQSKGTAAQAGFYRASGAADRIAEDFGLSQCTNILGLSDVNAQDA